MIPVVFSVTDKWDGANQLFVPTSFSGTNNMASHTL